MADESIEIIEPFEFHPCDSPRGMLYYDLNILTANQQIQLNDFKQNLIRENERYLARHPEIRALIALVTRHVLQNRPRSDLHAFVGQFFSRPKPDIQEELKKYIKDREPHVYEGDSAVIIREESSEESSESVCYTAEEEEQEEENLEAVPRKMLDEILQKAYDRLGIDVNDMGDWEPPDILGTGRTSGSMVNKIISDILERTGGSEGFSQHLTYLEDDMSQREDFGISLPALETPPVSEVTGTPTEIGLEEIQGVGEETTKKVSKELNQEVVEESKQEEVRPFQEEKQLEGPIEEVVKELKQDVVEELKQEDVEASQQEQQPEEPTQ